MNRRLLSLCAIWLILGALLPARSLAGGSNWMREWRGREKAPKVKELRLQLPEGLPGALSGLYRDPEGFYWSHTDQGTGIPGFQVRLVKLKITPAQAKVLEVIPLRDEQGNPVTGDLLDPEDVLVAPDGTLWLTDEIYPLIVQVSRDGQILQRVTPPAKYAQRTSGRGFEGAAISPDGRTLYAILQTGLTTAADKSETWLLAYDMESGTFKEYRYQLDKPTAYDYPASVKPWIGANALASVGQNELLVLERDNLKDENARVKRVYRIALPHEPTDTPLEKELVLDLYALGYRLEKVEGLAAPHPNTLVLINDNDADSTLPTVVWYVQR